MAEKGFDLSGHYSKGPGEFLGKKTIRYLIIVCGNAENRCPKIFPGVLFRLFWPFDDPAATTGTEAEKLAAFIRTRVSAIREFLIGNGSYKYYMLIYVKLSKRRSAPLRRGFQGAVESKPLAHLLAFGFMLSPRNQMQF